MKKSEQTVRFQRTLKVFCAEGFQRVREAEKKKRKIRSKRNEVRVDSLGENEQVEDENDDFKKIWGWRYNKDILELMITRKEFKYKKFVNAEACKIYFGDEIIRYIADNVESTNEKDNKKPSKDGEEEVVSEIIKGSDDVDDVDDVDVQVEIEGIIQHDLVNNVEVDVQVDMKGRQPDNNTEGDKNIGKFGINHSDDSNFKG